MDTRDHTRTSLVVVTDEHGVTHRIPLYSIIEVTTVPEIQGSISVRPPFINVMLNCNLSVTLKSDAMQRFIRWFDGGFEERAYLDQTPVKKEIPDAV